MRYGIDVSEAQGRIDWKQVAKSADFAIVRIGVRDYGTEGDLRADPSYRENLEGALDAGLPAGVYFVSQAMDAAEGAGEARFCVEQLKGYRLSYPVYFSAEYSAHPQQQGRADRISCAARTEAAFAFCGAMEDCGYFAGVYTHASFARQSLIDYGALAKHHAMWLADFRSNCGKRLPWGMRQCSKSGRVDGINAETGLNLCTVDYPWIIQKAGLNGWENAVPRTKRLREGLDGKMIIPFDRWKAEPEYHTPTTAIASIQRARTAAWR